MLLNDTSCAEAKLARCAVHAHGSQTARTLQLVQKQQQTNTTNLMPTIVHVMRNALGERNATRPLVHSCAPRPQDSSCKIL